VCSSDALAGFRKSSGKRRRREERKGQEKKELKAQEGREEEKEEGEGIILQLNHRELLRSSYQIPS